MLWNSCVEEGERTEGNGARSLRDVIIVKKKEILLFLPDFNRFQLSIVINNILPDNIKVITFLLCNIYSKILFRSFSPALAQRKSSNKMSAPLVIFFFAS